MAYQQHMTDQYFSCHYCFCCQFWQLFLPNLLYFRFLFIYCLIFLGFLISFLVLVFLFFFFPYSPIIFASHIIIVQWNFLGSALGFVLEFHYFLSVITGLQKLVCTVHIYFGDVCRLVSFLFRIGFKFRFFEIHCNLELVVTVVQFSFQRLWRHFIKNFLKF